MDYYPTVSAKETKQINKQTKWSTNLNRCMWEKLFNQKKKKINKWINDNNNNTNSNNNNNNNKEKREKKKRLKNW